MKHASVGVQIAYHVVVLPHMMLLPKGLTGKDKSS